MISEGISRPALWQLNGCLHRYGETAGGSVGEQVRHTAIRVEEGRTMNYPVEIKVNVEPTAIDAALAALDLEQEDAELRSIYFCEDLGGATPLALYKQGIIVRLRQGRDGGDCTVKLRPCDVSMLALRWTVADEADDLEYRIEEDWTGDHRVVSASLERKLQSEDLRSALASGELAALFSASQRQLVRECTTDELRPGRLTALGPVDARKWKVKRRGRKFNCEEWTLDPFKRFLELSVREDDSALAPAAQQQLGAFCQSLHLVTSSATELKTQQVLEYFADGRRPAAERSSGHGATAVGQPSTDGHASGTSRP